MRLMTGVLACCAWVAPLVAQDAIGVGMVQVEARIGEPLYFFAEPEFDALPDVTSAVDSITFEQGPWYVDIATAPPWLVPETLKLDYDLLLFRAHTVRRDFVARPGWRGTGSASGPGPSSCWRSTPSRRSTVSPIPCA